MTHSYVWRDSCIRACHVTHAKSHTHDNTYDNMWPNAVEHILSRIRMTLSLLLRIRMTLSLFSRIRMTLSAPRWPNALGHTLSDMTHDDNTSNSTWPNPLVDILSQIRMALSLPLWPNALGHRLSDATHAKSHAHDNISDNMWPHSLANSHDSLASLANSHVMSHIVGWVSHVTYRTTCVLMQ